MEFENETYQSHEEVIEQDNQPELDNNDNQNLDTIQDEEFDIIKYNKEEVKIPVSERQTYLQKGYHFDTVKQRAEEYEQQAKYLEKVAQFSGYGNTDEFIKALEQAQEQEKIQQEAQRLGVNEDAYRQHIAPVNEEVSQLRNELQQIKQQESVRAIEAEVDTLKSKYSDFAQHEDRVFDLAIERGYSLEDAYKIATYEERIETVSKQKEQEVLARITGRDEKQVLASNDKPSNATFDPTNMSLDDIQKISDRVRRGERITF
ncbi:hypothetical protein [Cytobacillus oceanisediminis]|uniref:hypothetical protein n=1 Tax=Cytobacillus oceanisediminis TaxID=665099 RepID=UPI0037357090